MSKSEAPQSLSAYRQMMDEALRTHDSWLALAGLFWLKPGVNTIGSGEASQVQLPAEHAPSKLGILELDGDHVFMRIQPPHSVKIDGRDVSQAELEPDTSESPTIVHLGPLTWVAIERGDRLGIRLWDNSRPEMHAVPGRSWFAEDSQYRVTAGFSAQDGNRELRIESTIGDVELVRAAGKLTFELEGEALSLQAMGDPDSGLWILFKDLTNGESTYAPGRYLTTGPVDGGRVELDFNRAYNPPCAFTAYATCPLPPIENHLPVRIEAGEKLPEWKADH
ncbi:MAG: DUF1684 domain-containing protein [Anaerolineales bacterium]